ncbi:MAG: hypothetical protein VX346_23150 [Planctomycetota bacterium]|nr:hypothetical protein [Planctomycetota bacterium]
MLFRAAAPKAHYEYRFVFAFVALWIGGRIHDTSALTGPHLVDASRLLVLVFSRRYSVGLGRRDALYLVSSRTPVATDQQYEVRGEQAPRALLDDWASDASVAMMPLFAWIPGVLYAGICGGHFLIVRTLFRWVGRRDQSSEPGGG